MPQAIVIRLDKFLRTRRISAVSYAAGALPPPELAYLVSFPRVAVTLTGCDEVEFETNGHARATLLPAGAALVVPPNAWNRPRWTRRVCVLNVLFGKKQIGVSLVDHDGRGSAPKAGCKAMLPGGATGTLHDIMHALLSTGDRPAPAPALMEALLHGVLDRLRNPEPNVRRKAATTHESVCLYLQEHFSFPLTRESVAEHFRITPSHVSRLFRREGLTGFSDYLNRVRIDRAKYLLRRHGIGLDEIAAKCGYADTAYFCRVFKQRTQRTPTRYRLESHAEGKPTTVPPS